MRNSCRGCKWLDPTLPFMSSGLCECPSRRYGTTAFEARVGECGVARLNYERGLRFWQKVKAFFGR